MATGVHPRGAEWKSMSVILAANWWSLFVRGLTALALGIVALVKHEMPLSDLALVFFGYAMFDGLLNLAGVVSATEFGERWGSLLFEALTGIAAALVSAAWPTMTMTGFIYLVAAWALITGVLEIFSAIRLRTHIQGEWLMILSGVTSIALGAVMVATPLAETSGLALWLGGYALLFGAILVALALRLRDWAGLPEIAPQAR